MCYARLRRIAAANSVNVTAASGATSATLARCGALDFDAAPMHEGIIEGSDAATGQARRAAQFLALYACNAALKRVATSVCSSTAAL